jgi:hypothetical protein
MRAIAVSLLTAITVVASGCLPQEARADGVGVRYTKKVKTAAHARRCGPYDRCGLPVVCPDGTCYPLYGAYGPYGGHVYWGRYTYSGWGYR